MKYVTIYNDHRSVELGLFDFRVARNPNHWTWDEVQKLKAEREEKRNREIWRSWHKDAWYMKHTEPPKE